MWMEIHYHGLASPSLTWGGVPRQTPLKALGTSKCIVFEQTSGQT